MDSTPSVLFMSCSDTHPDEIIKQFLNVSELPKKIRVEEDVYGFSWCIDNKYYTADVNLCSFAKKSLSSKKFADTVEAVVLYFDSSVKDALEQVESWLPFVNEYESEIKILLTNNVQNDETPTTNCTKKMVLEWCVGKGFELVELEPIIDEDSSNVEDDFPETTGVNRIIQALNAHVWPNLVMKTASDATKVPKKIDWIQSNLSREQLGLEESLEELLDDDDFSQLFPKLADFKERISSLPELDRKTAAEQVVKAFWKAMGGDENEFSDD